MVVRLGKLAVHNLLRARARLIMTASGVLVGTTAVILLVALTIGLQDAAEAGIGQSGSLTELFVTRSYDFMGGGSSSGTERPELTPQAVREFYSIDGVLAVIPFFSLQSWMEIRAGDYSGGGQILGIDPRLLPYLGVTVTEGTLSLESGQMLVGSQVSNNFYDPTAEEYAPVMVDMLNTPLQGRLYSNDGMNNRRLDLQVSGVLSPSSTLDWAMIMPIQDVIEMSEWTTGSSLNSETFVYDQVLVRVENREMTTTVSDAIKEMGFNTSGLGEFINQLNGFFSTMRLALGGVGGVALLVAAFGVANTMTMAILERTREIGLMKAVGATDQNVLTIFLIESALVGLFGGSAGVALSYLIQNVVNQALIAAQAAGGDPNMGGGMMFLPFDLSQAQNGILIIPSDLALFGLVLSTAVGVMAGLVPALRASRMTTVVALKTD